MPQLIEEELFSLESIKCADIHLAGREIDSSYEGHGQINRTLPTHPHNFVIAATWTLQIVPP